MHFDAHIIHDRGWHDGKSSIASSGVFFQTLLKRETQTSPVAFWFKLLMRIWIGRRGRSEEKRMKLSQLQILSSVSRRSVYFFALASSSFVHPPATRPSRLDLKLSSGDEQQWPDREWKAREEKRFVSTHIYHFSAKRRQQSATLKKLARQKIWMFEDVSFRRTKSWEGCQ